jgi:hypothetical protein
MMAPMTRPTWIVTLVLAACGGKAVIDGANGGGGGTGGTSTGSPDGAGPVGPGPGPGPTDEHGILCDQACNLFMGCDGDHDPALCSANCKVTNPNCLGQHTAWLGCLLDHMAPDCVYDAAYCSKQVRDYLQCEGICGGQVRCSQGSDGSCYCFAPCKWAYESSCYFDGVGFHCDCIRDGQVLGACYDSTGPGIDSCSPLAGCCSAFFFVGL